MRVAIQMDPVQSINIDKDTTFALGLEAQNRGYQLFYYSPLGLTFCNNRLTALAHQIALRRVHGDHFTLGKPFNLDLSDVDVILMRQDPPFDMTYITATHLLEHVHPKTLVVNDPFHVRNAPEKLLVTYFPQLTPPTMITSSYDNIIAFRDTHKDIIIKPLFGNGGIGVFHIGPDDENLSSLVEILKKTYNEPLIIQKYIPQIRDGDKRIILVDGKPAGAINRIPPLGEGRANLHIGGRAEKAVLTLRDVEICAAIGPVLAERGLILAGIDVIGDYLTEINVTSPTCIQEIDSFNGSNISALVWDAIIRRKQQN